MEINYFNKLQKQITPAHWLLIKVVMGFGVIVFLSMLLLPYDVDNGYSLNYDVIFGFILFGFYIHLLYKQKR